MTRVQQIGNYVWLSILGRPLTTLYLLASAVIIGGVSGAIQLDRALALLALGFLALLILGLHRENRIETALVKHELDHIQALVNSQHDDLLARVEQLIKTLQTAGIAVPAPEEKP